MQAAAKWWCAGGALLLMLGATQWESVYYRIVPERTVTTTADAFVLPFPTATAVAPAPGAPFLLKLDITPAPWPKEAGTIWSAMHHGAKVLVIVKLKDRDLSFRISGVDSHEHLIVPMNSESDARRLVTELGNDPGSPLSQ